MYVHASIHFMEPNDCSCLLNLDAQISYIIDIVTQHTCTLQIRISKLNTCLVLLGKCTMFSKEQVGNVFPFNLQCKELQKVSDGLRMTSNELYKNVPALARRCFRPRLSCRRMEIKMVMPLVIDMILADYSDLSRGHPKMCFSKEIPPKLPLI